MTFFTVHPFHSFNLAVVLLIAGKILTLNIDLLRRYSIPEPVAGGFLCIAVTGLLWALFDLKVSFEVGIRDFLLLVFFGRSLVIIFIAIITFMPEGLVPGSARLWRMGWHRLRGRPDAVIARPAEERP